MPNEHIRACVRKALKINELRGLDHPVRTVCLSSQIVHGWDRTYVVEQMAPRAGLEPATLRLTAGCSAIELPRNKVGVSRLNAPRRTQCEEAGNIKCNGSRSWRQLLIRSRRPSAGAVGRHIETALERRFVQRHVGGQVPNCSCAASATIIASAHP